MNKFEIWPVFSVPIFNSILDVSENELKYIKNLKRIPKFRTGFITEGNNILYHEELTELRNKIHDRFNFYKNEILQIKENFFVSASWGVIHHKNDDNDLHCHNNANFSGVLYLEVDENSGNIVFQTFEQETFQFNYNDWNIFNSKIWSVPLVKNQILIFPSKILHKIEKSKSDNERISMAFNFFVDKYSDNCITSELNFNN